MKNKRRLIELVTASIVMTVTGKLVSITSSDYVIDTGKELYSINRKAVPAGQSAKFERPGAMVSVYVTPAAVTQVRSKARVPLLDSKK